MKVTEREHRPRTRVLVANVVSLVWDTEFEVSVWYPSQDVEDLIRYKSDAEWKCPTGKKKLKKIRGLVIEAMVVGYAEGTEWWEDM